MLVCFQNCSKLSEDGKDTFVTHTYISTANHFFPELSVLPIQLHSVERVFWMVKCVSGLCDFVSHGTGVKTSILQEPHAPEFVGDSERNLLLQHYSFNQLTPCKELQAASSVGDMFFNLCFMF